MTSPEEALAQSVKARLVQRAHHDGRDPNLVLSRFALERLLYRLSRSPHGERFVLKGAMMLLVWFGDSARPTRDADLLGLDDLGADQLEGVFREVCLEAVESDGMTFDPDTVSVQLIRRNDPHGGHRITIRGRLGSAKLKVQIDVGLGDSVTPPPERTEYPVLLDHPRPRLRAYRPETTIAEKLHAMVSLGIATSRMRDFYDIYVLAARMELDGQTLAAAVRATFENRGLPIPREIPPTLTTAFAREQEKQVQWRAFLRKSGLDDIDGGFERVVRDIAAFLLPVIEVARGGADQLGSWPAGGSWEPAREAFAREEEK